MAAEAIAAEVVTVVLKKLTDEAFKRIARAQGIHSELKDLKKTLSRIQDLLVDASQKEVTEKTVQQWLNDLRHLVYDIDDVLDDVATEAMHDELNQEPGATTSKVRKLIPTCCSNFSLSHRLSPKLDSINKDLQDLEIRKKDLGLIKSDKKPKNTSTRNESSLLESNVVGRQVEKEKLLNMLLSDEPSEENFSIVPIVGMGGVGKTTLARLLYNDTKVQGHFESKAWVCISDDFDIFKISSTILQSVTIENKEFKDLNLLQMALTEQIKGKRFLLVVDDVWNVGYKDWENLVRPLLSCAPRSRIIMTTRKEQLLRKLGFDHLDSLNSLSPEDALSLFSFNALGVANFDSHTTLKTLGEGIVKKCAGLPLALKAIGRLLRTKIDEEYWENVLNSEIWDLENSEESSDKIVPALMLSYHDLSANLKQLFTYCSLFPKDFLFDKNELVLLWTAEGLLNPTNATKLPESLGHEYFDILLSKSFFQHAPDNESLFMMHDLMNDLATFVAGDFFLRFENHTETRKKDLAKHRHMSFTRETYVSYHKFEAFKTTNLRTLLAVYVGVEDMTHRFFLSNKILDELLPELPLLRVLSLSHFVISEVPECIGTLKHLRYLNLSHTMIKVLPENIGNLYNLETLIVFSCKELSKLPNSFLKLKRLRQFDIRDTPLLVKLPLGIGELESLQTLSKIIIEGNDGIAINKLKDLKNLRGKLSIKGLHNIQNATHAREANLSLKKITELELDWDHVFDGSRRGTLEKEVLNELKPHSNVLESIHIECYGGIEFPGWVADISFLKLVDVSISDCRKCTSLPSLGQLPSLKKLDIGYMDEVKDIGLEFTGTEGVCFPKLEILSFKRMDGWEKWSISNQALDVIAFPCLQEFKIKRCRKLIDISLEAIPSLRVLDIDECGSGVLKSIVQAASSISKLVIDCISGLTDEVWRGVIKNLGGVEEVKINNCHDIRYLWESEEEASKVLVKLKELRVRYCQNLRCLGEKEEVEGGNFGSNLLSSLMMLDVSKCDNMERVCCPNSIGIDRLSIQDCASLTRVSFPSTATGGGGGRKLKSLEIYGCNELMENINNASMPKLEQVEIGNLAILNSVLQLGNTHLATLGIRRLSIESFPDLSLPNLTDLSIFLCANLKSVFHLSKFIHLAKLSIEYCPCIESFPDLQLPNLTDLSISDCKNLKSVFQLSKFIHLTTLRINFCPSIESFPNLSNLTMLNHMEIGDCSSMDVSFPGLLWPPKLVSLRIWRLEKLFSVWGAHSFPTSLVDLCLYYEPHVRDFHLLSSILPSSLTSLYLYYFHNLESLSMGLQHLTSLQHLAILYCPKMKHLPEVLLPSLLSLSIVGCPDLKERCNGRGSHYWPLISHIPCIEF